MSDVIKSNRRNLTFILLLIVIAAIFYAVRGEKQGVTFDLEGDSFVLHGPEEFAAEINLQNLVSFETRTEYDPGKSVSGGTSGAYSYGIWENREFGQYRLCVLTKVPACVVFTERDGTVTVANFENAETTEEFGKSFGEYLRENGYL